MKKTNEDSVFLQIRSALRGNVTSNDNAIFTADDEHHTTDKNIEQQIKNKAAEEQPNQPPRQARPLKEHPLLWLVIILLIFSGTLIAAVYIKTMGHF